MMSLKSASQHVEAGFHLPIKLNYIRMVERLHEFNLPSNLPKPHLIPFTILPKNLME